MTGRLRDPDGQLPRVIPHRVRRHVGGLLALAVTTIGLIGPAWTRRDSADPLADPLRVAIGPPGVLVAAVVAIALVLTAVNVYLTGAAALAERLRPSSRPTALQLAVAVSGMAILGAVGACRGRTDRGPGPGRRGLAALRRSLRLSPCRGGETENPVAG